MHMTEIQCNAHAVISPIFSVRSFLQNKYQYSDGNLILRFTIFIFHNRWPPHFRVHNHPGWLPHRGH
ncbi:hypothetical protein KK467_29485, partial [Klebsiella pneumoniae]|uniref:hypothetical protein n=1 Tax=Klebsiella pneumoniae TaxID=573 RepID=UPI001BE0DE25